MNKEAKGLLEDAKYWTSMTVTTLTRRNNIKIYSILYDR